MRGRAVEQDLDLLDRILGDLADEGAEHLGELDERLQPRRFLRGDRRHVDGVGDRALDQIVRHLLGDLQRDVFLRLGGRGAEMRRATTFSMPNSGFSVAGSTSNTSMPAPATLPLFSAAIRSASTISPPRAQLMMRTPSFILAIACGVDDVPGLVGQRRVQRDEVGAGEKLVELDLLDAELRRAVLRQERVVGDDMHLQADAARRDDRADIAAADDAERLAGDLDAHEAVLLPLAGMGRGVGLRDLAGQREHHRDGMLGGGDRIAERRVHDDDALAARRPGCRHCRRRCRRGRSPSAWSRH